MSLWQLLSILHQQPRLRAGEGPRSVLPLCDLGLGKGCELNAKKPWCLGCLVRDYQSLSAPPLGTQSQDRLLEGPDLVWLPCSSRADISQVIGAQLPKGCLNPWPPVILISSHLEQTTDLKATDVLFDSWVLGDPSQKSWHPRWAPGISDLLLSNSVLNPPEKTSSSLSNQVSQDHSKVPSLPPTSSKELCGWRLGRQRSVPWGDFCAIQICSH